MVTVRPAGDGDGPDLLAWRNDPVARAASIDQRPVSPETHVAWFARVLADPQRHLYIGEDASGASIGMVRFDDGPDGDAEVSINLGAEVRGRGFGRELLREAISAHRRDAGLRTLRARIRVGNTASVRLFRGAGFLVAGGSAEVIELVLREDPAVSR